MRKPFSWMVFTVMFLVGMLPWGNVSAYGDERADVRVIHAAPDLDAADFYINDIFAGTLNYGESAPYLIVPLGSATVRAVAPGAGAAGTPLFEGTFIAEANQVVNVAVMGSSGGYSLGVYPVDRSPLAFGQSRVKIIHAVVGGATANLSALAPDESVVTLANGLSFGGSAFVEVPAGSYSASANGLLSSAALNVSAGTIHTVFLIGTADGSQPIKTLVFNSAAGVTGAAGNLRIVHALPDAPTVNLYLNDTLVAPFMDFSESTVYLALPPGNYRAALYATGTSPASGQPLLQSDITLAERDWLTGVVMGDAAAPALTVYQDDLSAVPDGQSRLTVFNAQANPLSGTVDGQPAIDGMLIGQLSAARLLAPTPHTLAFSANGAALATLDNFAVSPNTAFNLRTVVVTDAAPIVLSACSLPPA